MRRTPWRRCSASRLRFRRRCPCLPSPGPNNHVVPVCGLVRWYVFFALVAEDAKVDGGRKVAGKKVKAMDPSRMALVCTRRQTRMSSRRGSVRPRPSACPLQSVVGTGSGSYAPSAGEGEKDDEQHHETYTRLPSAPLDAAEIGHASREKASHGTVHEVGSTSSMPRGHGNKFVSDVVLVSTPPPIFDETRIGSHASRREVYLSQEPFPHKTWSELRSTVPMTPRRLDSPHDKARQSAKRLCSERLHGVNCPSRCSIRSALAKHGPRLLQAAPQL